MTDLAEHVGVIEEPDLAPRQVAAAMLITLVGYLVLCVVLMTGGAA